MVAKNSEGGFSEGPIAVLVKRKKKVQKGEKASEDSAGKQDWRRGETGKDRKAQSRENFRKADEKKLRGRRKEKWERKHGGKIRKRNVNRVKKGGTQDPRKRNEWEKSKSQKSGIEKDWEEHDSSARYPGTNPKKKGENAREDDKLEGKAQRF